MNAGPPPNKELETFSALPDELDFPSMEQRILKLWDLERTFDRLREKNSNGAHWSFIDGPITANNPMGVHHAWGRTYKDVFQRYRAMRGFNQRFQNGFDCQGLWLEVEVEKELGFKSKRDIEAYGLAAFADACRNRVNTYASIQTEQSIRLGQWMDWDNSYYTHSDKNIEHIWHFLSRCHDRGWIMTAQRAMPWCARCGTALSQHELIDTYEDVSHEAVYVRLPVRDRENTSLLVWTTTPWTLAANVAAAVHPQLDYVEVEVGNQRYILAEAALESALNSEFEVIGRMKGAEMIGWTYDGPFDDLPAVGEVVHEVIPWEEIGAEEGTGIVHIAPGAGEEDFDLGRDLGLAIVVPIDENGEYVDGFGWLTGRDARQVAADVISDLDDRNLLHRAHTYQHRYPHCWRCREELVFRVDDEWFIRADEVREPMQQAAASVQWVPEYAGARMADWLSHMGDWNISRRRFWGLPLPFYPCTECGHLTVIGSRQELEERALEGIDGLRELHRPWIDDVVIRCESCDAAVRRITAVGDAWLDAGIVPFSTLDYMQQSDAFASWYPADFVSEMREQIRLWFYSMLFMSVTLEGRSPYHAVFVYEKLNDETGRPMHKSWGNSIDFGEAADRMGADVMRWMYAGHNPVYNINFGYGPATEVKRRMLTLWNVYAFFVTYARLDGFDPTAPGIPVAQRPDLDRWALSRLQGVVETFTDSLDNYLVYRGVQAAQAFIEDLSNWYVRRGRRRYWKSSVDADKQAAYQTLYELLTTLVRLLAPVMPFWTEDMYQNLVRRPDPAAVPSVHLSDWPVPDVGKKDAELERSMGVVQRVVRVGRAARNGADVKLRQPLRSALIRVDDGEWASVISLEQHVRDELNVKAIERMVSEHDLVEFELRPNYRVLGPKFGARVKSLAVAIEALDPAVVVRQLETDGQLEIQFDGDVEVLSPDDVLIQRTPREGFGVSEQDGVIVAIATDVDDVLRRDGFARELVHATQGLRREAGLEVSDRILLWIEGGDEVKTTIAEHRDRISEEVLAVSLNEGRVVDDVVTQEVILDGHEVQLSLASSAN